MIQSIFVILAAIGVACAYVLYTGGRQGVQVSNPWWFMLSAASVLLSLHAIGVLLPDAEWFKWAAITLALVGSVFAGLQELRFWNQDLLPRPANREFIMEIVLIVTGFIAARQMDSLLPDVHRVTILSATLIPLLMIRWASTRLVSLEGRPRRRDR